VAEGCTGLAGAADVGAAAAFSGDGAGTGVLQPTSKAVITDRSKLALVKFIFR
jgi:hypothetical protein